MHNSNRRLPTPAVTTMKLLVLTAITLMAAGGSALGFPAQALKPPATIPTSTPVSAPALAFVALDDRLPRTKLRPAVYVPDLCLYRYRVGTRSADCQKFLDQALGYYYSYVWIEAARSAETALKFDPECAYAWLVLHKGLEKWGKGDATAALKKAQELMPRASHREQMLITARLHEKGLMGTASVDERRKKAAQTLDEMLTIYDDDEEAWFARGAMLGGFQGGPNEGIPYYKALLRVNPVHPGANHELVHFYEGSKRPALGWPYAVGYMDSSPGIPHAFHMQAHLATRIGKWEHTSDWSSRAVAMEREYHRVQGVPANDDHQYSHHLETLTLSLLHDGRFREAQEIRKEAQRHGYRFTAPWFRLAIGQRDWAEAEAIVAQQRKSDKNQASYMAALLSLERGDLAKAAAEVDVLRQAQQTKKSDTRLEQRLFEVQGRLQCATGSGEAGLKLLQRVVDKTKKDYYHHSWGGGAYFMEAWGTGALDCGNAEQAEEAFLESLAHDAGSVKAALGMEALCRRLGRTSEAANFAALATRLWSKADPRDLEALRSEMVARASHVPLAATTAAGGR
jgi:tetratricopeptide (TPR) repeat protein